MGSNPVLQLGLVGGFVCHPKGGNNYYQRHSIVEKSCPFIDVQDFEIIFTQWSTI
jgi:hypothetical protein